MRSASIAFVLLTACAGTAGRAPSHFDLTQFAPLFDGATLNGFVTTGGRYDGHADWRVEDGAIVGRQADVKAGGLLYTERQYRDFEFSVEVFLTYPFDSGIFVRMVPPPGGKGVQVTLDYRPGGEIGAIYADGFLARNDTASSLWRRDAWNRVDVRCRGTPIHVEAWLDGTKIADHRVADPDAYASIGRIGLQVHGGRDEPPDACVKFRDLRIRELQDASASEERAAPTRTGGQ